MKHKSVKDIELTQHMSVNTLINEFHEAGGFTASKLASGVNILERMVKNPKCTIFLAFPACIMATGTRGVILELMKRRIIDIVITTCGTLDHDLARIWRSYYHGSFQADDQKLHSQGIHRLGNIFIPMDNYGSILEKKLQPLFTQIFEKQNTLSTKLLTWEIGKKIEKENSAKSSILYWAWKQKIPMYIPGIMDGAVGSQLWLYYQQNRKIGIDLMQDEQELSDIIFNSKQTGAFIIGGGISKHHTIWWNQFKNGLDYAVYITTAVEYDGSLSGAQTREAISWGKIAAKSDNVTIEGDATVLVPLMIAALLDRIS